jgi:hypothetical protein
MDLHVGKPRTSVGVASILRGLDSGLASGSMYPFESLYVPQANTCPSDVSAAMCESPAVISVTRLPTSPPSTSAGDASPPGRPSASSSLHLGAPDAHETRVKPRASVRSCAMRHARSADHGPRVNGARQWNTRARGACGWLPARRLHNARDRGPTWTAPCTRRMRRIVRCALCAARGAAAHPHVKMRPSRVRAPVCNPPQTSWHTRIASSDAMGSGFSESRTSSSSSCQPQRAHHRRALSAQCGAMA